MDFVGTAGDAIQICRKFAGGISMEIQNRPPNWLNQLSKKVAYAPRVVGSDYQPLALTWKTQTIESSLCDRRMHQCISSERHGETRVTVAGGWCLRRSVRCNDIHERTSSSLAFKSINRSAEWSPRHSFSFLSTSDGRLLYVIGGDDGGICSDVWLSTDGARSFKRQCDDAPWRGRIDFSAAIVDDILVVCGGRIPHRGGLDEFLNDVWVSRDRGQSWVVVCEAAPWKRRACSAMIVVDNLLLMAGGQGDISAMDDVWVSKDLGVSWKNASSKRIPWNPRKSPNLVLDPVSKEVLLIGGLGADNAALTDSWASIDSGCSWIPRNHIPESVLPHATVTTTNSGSVFVLGAKAESESVSDLRFVKKDCLFLLLVGTRIEHFLPKDLWIGKILPYAVDTRQLWDRESVAWKKIHRAN